MPRKPTKREAPLAQRLCALKEYLELKKEKASNKSDMEFLEGMLFCIEELNNRIVVLEEEALPGDSYISAADVPHRIQ